MTAICGMFNFFRIQEVIFECTNYDRKIINAWTNFLTDFYRAEGIDKVWTKNNYCPTESEYFSNMTLKVCGVMYFFIQLMQPQSSLQADFKPFSETLAAYVQLRDDYENLFMPEDYFKKRETFAEDLTHGKITLPVIHAIRVKENKEIMSRI
jgi:geranylgeranyl pyrophosphate synthase